MPIAEHGHPQRHRLPHLVTAAVALLISASGAVASGHGDSLRLPGTALAATGAEVAVGWPGPPPPITPALVEKFYRLLVAYEMVARIRSISFGEWLLLNGVANAREWQGMMWLYWRYRTGQPSN